MLAGDADRALRRHCREHLAPFKVPTKDLRHFGDSADFDRKGPEAAARRRLRWVVELGLDPGVGRGPSADGLSEARHLIVPELREHRQREQRPRPLFGHREFAPRVAQALEDGLEMKRDGVVEWIPVVTFASRSTRWRASRPSALIG